jgi:hypothetical protein
MVGNTMLGLGGEDVSTIGAQENRIKSPEWLICIDDLLSSSTKGFETYTELFEHKFENSRETKGNVSGGLISSAAVAQSDVIVIIKNAIYVPMITNHMNSGRVFEMITLLHLGNYKDKRVPIETIEFSKCQISSIARLQNEKYVDKVAIRFRPNKQTDTYTDYDQDGNKTGQTVSEFDYSKGE